MRNDSSLFGLETRELIETIREAGVAGAGGAGFPAYAKWDNIDKCDYLLVNHQESEPVCYTDKWLAREYSEELGEFLTAMLDTAFDSVLIGAKEKDRDEWTRSLESATDARVYQTDDLPVSIEQQSGVIFVYTPDIYTYSEESVLLRVSTGTPIGDDLPTNHGWIVHNTETLYNIYRGVRDGSPVTRKYVHVDGDTPQHRCLEVPIGTPATDLLKAAGVDDGCISTDQVLADGGPGWCYEIDMPADEFGVRKRTNAVLVIEKEVADSNTKDDGQIDVLDARDWTARKHETTPAQLIPNSVRIPLITNAAYEGLVRRSEPIVNVGDTVSVNDVIAAPSSEGISNPQHASIDGTITEITKTHIMIERG